MKSGGAVVIKAMENGGDFIVVRLSGVVIIRRVGGARGKPERARAPEFP